MTVNNTLLAALSLLQASWRQVLLIHLVYMGLGFILFAPLLGALGQLLLKMSGEPALADMDLLFFALSPTGLVAFGLFAAVALVFAVFELASLMVMGVAAANGHSINVGAALGFSLKKFRPIFALAGWLLIRLSITIAPFLLAATAVAFFLITEYDINYYLAVKPAEFLVAVSVIGLIVFVMSALLIRDLVRWSLALPQVLLAGIPPAKSFAASASLTAKRHGIILGTLLVWGLAALLLGMLVTIFVQILADFFVPLSTNSVPLLALSLGLLSVFWLLGSTLATALTTGSLALLLASLAHQLDPQFRQMNLHSDRQRELVLAKIPRRGYMLGFVAAVGIAAFISFTLLDEINIVDDTQIIAHRGAAGAAPENTMAAIRRAVVDGADWVEIDVQETNDGEVVVIHDSDLMKLAGENLRVWEANLPQLAEIDVGSWFGQGFAGERVPTLAAVLAEVKGHSKVIVELKYYGHDQQLEQRVIDLIEQAEMQDDTMIMSLSFAGIQKVRALRPDWKTGLLSARAIGNLTGLDTDFLAVNMAMARPALIKAAHEADKEIYVWTVNDALAMSQLMSLGVDGIITDEPLLGREVLAARAELSSVQRLLLHIAPLLGVEAPSLSIETNDAGPDDTDIPIGTL